MDAKEAYEQWEQLMTILNEMAVSERYHTVISLIDKTLQRDWAYPNMPVDEEVRVSTFAP